MPASKSTVIAIVVLIAISIAAFYLLQQPEPAGPSAERTYQIDYSGLVAEKTVEISAAQHTETIKLSADAQNLGFVIYTVVPKSLAADAGDIDFTTNARVEVLEPDPLIRISTKNVPNAIAVKMSFPNAGGKDICTVNAVLPASFVADLTAEQHAQLNEELLTLDLDLNCDSANALENTLAENLYNSFTGG